MDALPARLHRSFQGEMDRLYTFLGLFSLVYFFESIGHSYIISALQNIEKQFQIPSRLSGFMISAGRCPSDGPVNVGSGDIGYIPSVLFVAYLGSKGNRARWIGGGALLMACAYLLMSSPNFIFPVITPRANLTQIEVCNHGYNPTQSLERTSSERGSAE